MMAEIKVFDLIHDLETARVQYVFNRLKEEQVGICTLHRRLFSTTIDFKDLLIPIGRLTPIDWPTVVNGGWHLACPECVRELDRRGWVMKRLAPVNCDVACKHYYPPAIVGELSSFWGLPPLR